MWSSRQRIVVYLLAFLSVVMLLHVHAALESGSTHCTICVQQSHGIVEQTIEVPRDEQVRVVTAGDDLAAPALAFSRTASPRAPPA